MMLKNTIEWATSQWVLWKASWRQTWKMSICRMVGIAGLTDDSGVQRIARVLSKAEQAVKAQIEGRLPIEEKEEACFFFMQCACQQCAGIQAITPSTP